MGKWDGPKNSMEGVAAGEVEISGKPEEGPEDVIELLQSHNKTWTNKLLFLFFKEFYWAYPADESVN